MRFTTFDIFQELMRNHAGLQLEMEKSFFLEARLAPLVKKWDYRSVDALARDVEFSPDPILLSDITDALMDHKTQFFCGLPVFRDFTHQVLPYLARARDKAKSVSLWSCACSSGQEAYSYAIAIDEAEALPKNWSVNILGSDISESVIEKAKQGAYSQLTVQRGLRASHLLRYFDQDGHSWNIKQKLQEIVEFKAYNLLNRLTHFGTFDVISCANTLTHFDKATQQQVVKRLLDRLTPDGFFITGLNEDISGMTDKLMPFNRTKGIYVLKGSVHDG